MSGDRVFVVFRALGHVDRVLSTVEHEPDPHPVLQFGALEAHFGEEGTDEAVACQIDLLNTLRDGRLLGGPASERNVVAVEALARLTR